MLNGGYKESWYKNGRYYVGYIWVLSIKCYYVIMKFFFFPPYYY